MKGGGTAGGGKAGSNLQFIKKTPKFLEQFRMGYAKKEDTVQDKFFSMDRDKLIEMAKEDYDTQNATVVNKDEDASAEGYLQSFEKPEEGGIKHDVGPDLSDPFKRGSMLKAPKPTTELEKQNLDTFKPTFKAKVKDSMTNTMKMIQKLRNLENDSPGNSSGEEKRRRKSPEKEKVKSELMQKKDETRGFQKKADEKKEKSESQKKLDDVVNEYLKKLDRPAPKKEEEAPKESKPQKKVKTNEHLLSFDD
mgnify:FL=1